ncbi:MAG: helix-hairpin-helix domain-containing protein [Chthoniobacterales bacterium]
MRRAIAAALAALFCLTSAEAHGPWRVIKQCREIPNDSNDGDSFHVRAAGQEYIFRLYFADAPETDNSFPVRVGEQAQYFHLTTAQTLQLGGYAKKFTEEKLSRPFTVRTCMQGALGRSKHERFYAFIETDEGDLAELLIANGMARVHGSAATPVNLRSPEREWEKLRGLENEARSERVGGWGAATGRMTARLTRQPARSGPDSFEAFFHSERSAAARAPAANSLGAPLNIFSAPPPGTSAPSVVRLDLNMASATELDGVKGIGPVLAGRIMAARPFKTVQDLRLVKGIGAKKYEQLRPYFREPTGSASAR